MEERDFVAIVLAGGKGARMTSDLPKVLHDLSGWSVRLPKTSPENPGRAERVRRPRARLYEPDPQKEATKGGPMRRIVMASRSQVEDRECRIQSRERNRQNP